VEAAWTRHAWLARAVLGRVRCVGRTRQGWPLNIKGPSQTQQCRGPRPGAPPRSDGRARIYGNANWRDPWHRNCIGWQGHMIPAWHGYFSHRANGAHVNRIMLLGVLGREGGWLQALAIPQPARRVSGGQV